MAEYAIGDIQGCYNALMRLLDLIQFNDRQDKLWLVGDLINRGPKSLEVIRFVQNLPIKPHISLGNHDLHLLRLLWAQPAPKQRPDDTLYALLQADDAYDIGHWLRQQSFICYDEELNVVMSHAGIAPFWTLNEALSYARELELVLRGPHYQAFLNNLYDPNSNHWSADLKGFERARVICNYFTFMRYCHANGDLAPQYKGPPPVKENIYPWYELPTRVAITADIVFGHWSALMGTCPIPRIHALDTGCVWGETLTAMRLSNKQRFMVQA